MSAKFGHLLRQYRIEAGFSQEHLAGLAKISVESVGALERGTRRAPYRETVELLVKALRLTGGDRRTFEAAADSARLRRARNAIAGKPAPPSRQLPIQSTSFIGRALDVAAITTLISENRLVTVTGSGGVGKTRIGIEVAARSASAYRDDVRFVDLSSINDGRFIVGAIDPRLGSSFIDPSAAIDEANATLGAANMLLVIDNCEHLIADVALLVSAVLRSCPNVSILATSRERLAISGEVVYRLPSLELPARHPSDIRQARTYSALDLFMQRAAMTDRSVEFDDAAVDSLVDICRRLDGIPLAIELAAARVATLGLENVRVRLSHGMTVNAGARNLPARQQTMVATIGWSYDLLSAVERAVLQRVSVFVGGFTLAAAEVVCPIEGIDADAVADVLSSLVDKSLINVTSSEGRTRYSILDSVKTFAAERSRAAGDSDTLSLRHAEWLASFADWIEETRFGKPEPWLRAQTAPELENARKALSWTLQSGSREHALLAGRIAGGLRTIWLTSGRRGECARWAEAALAAIDEECHLEISARLLRAMVQATNDAELLRWGSRAVLVFEQIGDRVGTALLHSHLANHHRMRGELTKAEFAITRSSEILSEVPRSMQYALMLQNRWQIHLACDRYEDALSDISEAISIVKSFGDLDAYRWVVSRSVVKFAMGKSDEALRDVETVTNNIIESGTKYEGELVHAYGALALFRLAGGDLKDGISAAREGLLRTRSWQGVDALQAELMYVAALAAALRGEARLAARILGSVEGHWDIAVGYVWRYRDLLLIPSLLDQITPEELQVLRAEGGMQPPDAVIAETLRVLSD